MPYTKMDVSGVGLDQYRAAVNYNDVVNRADRANKGYVRFVGGGRSVSLAKVNNKVDIAIGLRSGISEANNRLVREQFLQAISNDLAYMAPDKANAIREKILGGAETQSTPLSRREIHQAFSLFDREFNTAEGRRKIVENILREAAISHEFCHDGLVDVEGFCRQAFNQTPEEFLGRYAEAFKRLEGASEVDKAAGQGMLMDEAEFRGLLVTIREVTDVCANVARTDRTLRDTVKGWVDGAVKGSYGFSLDEKNRENWMKALRPVVAGFDCQKLAPEGSVGVNYGEKLLELFVDNILAHELKAALDNVFQVGAENDAKLLEEALDAYVSYDAIENLAIDFFSRASDPKTLETISKLAVKESDDQQVALSKNAINATIDRFLKVGTYASAKMDAMLQVYSHAAVDRQTAAAIGGSVAGALNIFATEAKLDWFVKAFVADRYGKEAVGSSAEESGSIMKGQLAKARDAADRAVVAAQSAFGIRIVNYEMKDGKKVVSSAVNGTDGMGGFANKVMNTLVKPEILAELKCTESDLYEFATLTFPNVYSDIKAQLIKAQNGEVKETDLFSDDNAAKVVFALKDAYREVRTELAGFDRDIAAFQKSFLKLLDRYVKGGKLTETQANEVRARLASERSAIRMTAARELALVMPIGTDETRAKQARWIMADAAQTLRAHLTHGLATLVRTSSIGFAAKKELDPELNLKLAVTAWKEKAKHDGAIGTDPFHLHFVADDELESRFYAHLMTDFEDSLTKKVGKTGAQLNDKDVGTVRDNFKKKVADRLNAYREFETEFLEGLYNEGVESMMDGLKAQEAYKNLPKDVLKPLAGEVIRGAMLTFRNEIRETLFDFIDHGGKGAKVDDLIEKMTSQEVLGPKVDLIMKERAAEFDRWMEGGALRTRMESDIFAAVKGNPPEGVNETELQRMITANGQAFFEQAEKVKGLMVSGGKLAFCHKASEAILNGLEKRIADFAAFKKAFLAKVPEIDAKYASMTDKAQLCENFLIGLASEPPKSLKPEREAEAYDKLLFAHLKNIIGTKEKELKSYRSDYVFNYDRVRDRLAKDEIPALAERLEGALVDVDGDALDRKALASEMAETFRKVYTEAVSYEIARDPVNFPYDLDPVVTPAVNGFADRVAANLKLFEVGHVGEGQMDPALKPWDRLDDLIRDVGFGRYLAKDNVLTDRLHTHLNTFMAGDTFKALHLDALKAAAAHAWAEMTGMPVPESAAKAILAYRQAFADEIASFIATACSVDKLNGDIPLAKAFIDLELARRNLPDETDAYGADVRSRTHEAFAVAVKEEAEKMFAATAEGRPYTSELMTQASLDAFIARIEADCYTTFASSYVESLSNEIFDELAERKGGHVECFTKPKAGGEVGARLAEVVKVNCAELRAVVGRVVTEATNGCLTYDKLSAMTQNPDFLNALNNKIAVVTVGTMERCLSRVNFELDYRHALETAVESFERALMRWMFATPTDGKEPFASLDQILADPRVKKDSKLTDGDKWSDHRMAIRTCCQNFRKGVEAHIDELRRQSLTANVKVVDAICNYGNTYLERVLCDDTALKDTKALMTAYAKAVADAIGYEIPGTRSGIFGFFKKLF